MPKYSDWSDQQLISEYKRLDLKAKKFDKKASNIVPDGPFANFPTIGNLARAVGWTVFATTSFSADNRSSKIAKELQRRGYKDYY